MPLWRLRIKFSSLSLKQYCNVNVFVSVNRTSVPPVHGAYFHANVAQVRPRTRIAGVKWIMEVEVKCQGRAP